MKKLRCLLVVFALIALCSSILTASAIAETENVPTIGNTTFASATESGSTFSWTSGSSEVCQKTIDTTTDHTGDGSYSLKLTNTEAKHNVTRFKITNLTAGKDYKFSIWLKLENFTPALYFLRQKQEDRP